MPLSIRWLFKPPSSRYVTESERPPPMLYPPACRGASTFFGVTPGCVASRSSVLRPFSGNSEDGDAADRGADGGVLGFHRAGPAFHRDHVLDRAHLKREVDAQRLVDLERVLGGHHHPRESDCFSGHFVPADRQFQHLVVALFIGRGLPGNPRTGIRDGYLGAGNHAAAGIGDDADNLARRILRQQQDTRPEPEYKIAHRNLETAADNRIFIPLIVLICEESPRRDRSFALLI